jgi:hypothetical protein
MKNFILVIVLIALMVQVSTAQTNVFHPMPDSNAIWHEILSTGTYVDGDNPCFDCMDYQYQIIGDTIVGSNTHHKLYRVGYGYNYTSQNGCSQQLNCIWTNTDYYLGCFREDTAARKDYYIYPADTTESLLYDFTLNVGDTLRISIHGPQQTGVVQKIDSIMVGTDYRKRWILDTSDVEYIATFIEGIGNTLGLLANFSYFEQNQHLLCFTQNTITLYHDSLSGDPFNPSSNCTLTVGIKELSKDKINMTIIPNPATTSITIHSTMSIINYQLSIEDVLGNKIYQQTITSNDTQIDVSTWSEGVYFYEVRGANDVARGKFVKAN